MSNTTTVAMPFAVLRQALPRIRLTDLIFGLCVVAIAVIGAQPATEAMFASIDRIHHDVVLDLLPQPNSQRVTVINLDQKTIDELGQRDSFARATHAKLLAHLQRARSVVFNMNFVSPSPPGQSLADAIAKNGRVVVPMSSSGGSAAADDKQLLAPTPAVTQAVAALGHRNFMVGNFKVVRGIFPYQSSGGAELPHIALEAIRVAGMHLPFSDIRLLAQRQMLSMTQQMADVLMLILPSKMDLAQYSYVDVLKGRIPAAAFANRIVFVGHQAFEASGSFNTSSLSEQSMSRNQVDALVTQALLDGRVMHGVPEWWKSSISLTVVLGLMLICMLAPGSRMHRFALLWIVAYFAVATALLAFEHVWLPVSATLVCCMLVYAAYAWRRLAGTHRLLKHELAELRQLSSVMGFAAQSEVNDRNGAANLMQPLHEIKQAMRQIRVWQEAYAGVINMLPYPIFLEQDGRIVLCNDKANAMLKAYASDGASIGVAEEAILGLAAGCRAQSQDGEAICVSEVTMGEREQLLLVTPFAFLNEADGAAKLISFVDIQDVKETVVNDRQALRYMAHDLRNPLTTMLALIEQQDGQGESGGGEAFLDDLRRLTNYSLRVAQDFMQLSRAEHLDPASFLPLTLNELASEALDQIGGAADQKQIALLAPDDDGGNLWVSGNYDMLLRATVNLLDNAVKYSPPGSAIVLRMERAQQYVCLSVQDQGIGIPEQALPQLFDPFFQVDKRCQSARNGVGLGLPFVRTVMERHGGLVEVASEVGRGSCFRLVLPAYAMGEEEHA
ncbi:ATP-binding protein [Paraherbaspirillum soli]|uniref:histidine kinase n=1 Tax=Paraherbaspirillum soli TaxID=631222 RepID=A0ABW0MG88_9BURK